MEPEQIIAELKRVYKEKAVLEKVIISKDKEIQKLKFQLQKEKSINSMLSKSKNKNDCPECGEFVAEITSIGIKSCMNPYCGYQKKIEQKTSPKD